MNKFRLPLLLLAGMILAVTVWFDQADTPAPSNRQVERGTKAAVQKTGPGGSNTPQSKAKQGLQPLNPLAALNDEQFWDTVNRPLFSPTRKPKSDPPPVVKKPAPAVKPTIDRNRYALLGIIVSDDKKAIALLRERRDGRSFRVEQGDTIGGWRVGDVRSDSVQLIKDGVSVILRLSGN